MSSMMPVDKPGGGSPLVRGERMEEAGQKLKRVRERLNLRFREVEEASLKLAQRHNNDEFAIALSRLSDIENKGTVPTFYRIYSLAVIYRLDPQEILSWYGVNFSELASDAAAIKHETTHPLQFDDVQYGDALLPLSLDPGLDLRQTSYLSRMIQRWGKLPLLLLKELDFRNHRYAFLGTEDWSMYPLLQPGSFLQVDESRRRIVNSGWGSEFERPIYFLEYRGGFACSWCTLDEDQLILQPHPASLNPPRVFRYPDDIDVIGQVVGVATRLDLGRRRRTSV